MDVRQTSELQQDEAGEALYAIGRMAKKATDEIGFIPTAGVWRHHDEGKLLIIRRGESLAGFCLTGGTKDVAQALQLYVLPEHRLHGCGSTLVEHLARDARRRGKQILRAKVADDLPAVGFWKRVGFRIKEVGPGGTRRGRSIYTLERTP